MAKQTVIDDYMTMWDKYEQNPFPVEFYTMTEGKREVIETLNVSVGFSCCTGDLLELGSLCSSFTSARANYSCRDCLVMKNKQHEPYEPANRRQKRVLEALWKNGPAPCIVGETTCAETALRKGYIGYHLQDGPPGLSGVKATQKAGCRKRFRNAAELLRLSFCIDAFAYDLLHTFGNGICSRAIDNIVKLIKASCNAETFNRWIRMLDERMQSDRFLWGTSPVSGTDILDFKEKVWVVEAFDDDEGIKLHDFDCY
jgi:hypothetical protein